MNYSQGNDDIKENKYVNRRIDETIDRGTARHQRFGFGITQVMTRKWLLALNAESVVDDGMLNNAYRWVRFLTPTGSGQQKEIYPETRSSDAFAFRSMYYLPFKSALKLEYRIFSDTWGIAASNYEIRYIHPVNERLMIEGKYRAYTQTAADFYSDLFPYIDAQNFLARDKEMSEYSNRTLGLGVTYKLEHNFLNWFDETTVNLYWDNFAFDYKNFRANTPENTDQFGIGNEPLYSLNANVIRLFLSVKY